MGITFIHWQALEPPLMGEKIIGRRRAWNSFSLPSSMVRDAAVCQGHQKPGVPQSYATVSLIGRHSGELNVPAPQRTDNCFDCQQRSLIRGSRYNH